MRLARQGFFTCVLVALWSELNTTDSDEQNRFAALDISDISIDHVEETDDSTLSFTQEAVPPADEPVSYLASLFNGLRDFFSRILHIFHWFVPFFAESPAIPAGSGLSHELHWPSVDSASPRFRAFPLRAPDGRIAGNLPLGLFLVPDDGERSYCIPPYDLAVHMKVTGETSDLEELILASLQEIATVMIKSFLRLHVSAGSITPCTDLLIHLPKKARISGKGLHFTTGLPVNKTSAHSTFNHAFDGNSVAEMTLASLQRSLTPEELRVFRTLESHVHFQATTIETPSTMAFLDAKCGLLYDKFGEGNKRYSNYVASEVQEKAFLAFFSDAKPPVEMERVVSPQIWDAFRMEAITQLRRSLGKFVPCRAHSSFSSAGGSIKGLCTSVKTQHIHNRSLSPLEKRGYIYDPVPDHMRRLWPELDERPGFDLQGVCFVATDRLVYEKLYDPNREHLLPLCWEKAIRKSHARISSKGREMIDKLAKAQLFCPCKSSALSNHVDFNNSAEDFQILVQTYDGEA